MKIEKDIRIKDESWNIHIPLLILQPLVENAIKHGIIKKEAGGTVQIQITESDYELKMVVTDNGSGMSPQTAQIIFKGEIHSAEGAGIGVKNIHERLIRYYGEGYGLVFETSPVSGTKVTVKIPLTKKTGRRKKVRL